MARFLGYLFAALPLQLFFRWLDTWAFSQPSTDMHYWPTALALVALSELADLKRETKR